MKITIKLDEGRMPGDLFGSVTAYALGEVVATVRYDWTHVRNSVQLVSDRPFFVQTRIADIGAMIVSSQTQPNRLWGKPVSQVSFDIDATELLL